jgi:hypothetical protein
VNIASLQSLSSKLRLSSAVSEVVDGMIKGGVARRSGRGLLLRKRITVALLAMMGGVRRAALSA